LRALLSGNPSFFSQLETIHAWSFHSPGIGPPTNLTPHPSEEEIKEFMELLGFAEVKGSYFGWFKQQGKIQVIDARPDNFIKTENGVIPVDLVISEES
jgi:hypothetical protein